MDKKLKLKTVKAVCYTLLGIGIAIALTIQLVPEEFIAVPGWIFVGIMAVLSIFVGKFWRCPSCNKHLGKLGKYQFCSQCGSKLDM